MQPLLISFSICLLGVMAAVFLFSFAMREKEEERTSGVSAHPSSGSGAFFLRETPTQDGQAYLHLDTLLMELERHFRMEEQAATLFLEGPSPDSLHAPSPSPFWD